MIQTAGKYFDGKQSQPQQVEVSFPADLGELKFQNDNISLSWKIAEITYEKIGSMIEIRIQERSDEFLTITDKDFNSVFIKCLHKSKNVGAYKKLLNLSYKTHLSIFAGLLVLLVLGYFFLVPFIAEKSVVLIPQSFDKQVAKMAITNIGFKTDSEKSAILAEFAQNIDFENKVDLNFKVVKSDMVNAYALPDGTVIVFTGILDAMNSYEQLAGLLGHEVSHINKRHSMKMLCKNLSGYIFVSALFSDINGIMTVIAENAHNLNTLTYSRKFENEADEQGTLIMIENGINPKGVISLFEILQNEEENSKIKIPEYISTHPFTSNRIENIEKIIEKQNYHSRDNSDLERIFKQLKSK
ncbi:MAG: M48 family metallopeptidase [Bacteroidales bacterium]|jgi:Zn-dependent protease with chaperone function|nr:M48 family metallopeptidase [Bacteroidales bacterium]